MVIKIIIKSLRYKRKQKQCGRFKTCIGFFFLVNKHRWQWWRHEMLTLSALRALAEGNPPVTVGLSYHWPSYSTWTFFYVSLSKVLNKRKNGLWFQAPWSSCDVTVMWHYAKLRLNQNAFCETWHIMLWWINLIPILFIPKLSKCHEILYIKPLETTIFIHLAYLKTYTWNE